MGSHTIGLTWLVFHASGLFGLLFTIGIFSFVQQVGLASLGEENFFPTLRKAEELICLYFVAQAGYS